MEGIINTVKIKIIEALYANESISKYVRDDLIEIIIAMQIEVEKPKKETDSITVVPYTTIPVSTTGGNLTSETI